MYPFVRPTCNTQDESINIFLVGFFFSKQYEKKVTLSVVGFKIADKWLCILRLCVKKACLCVALRWGAPELAHFGFWLMARQFGKPLSAFHQNICIFLPGWKAFALCPLPNPRPGHLLHLMYLIIVRWSYQHKCIYELDVSSGNHQHSKTRSSIAPAEESLLLCLTPPALCWRH